MARRWQVTAIALMVPLLPGCLATVVGAQEATDPREAAAKFAALVEGEMSLHMGLRLDLVTDGVAEDVPEQEIWIRDRDRLRIEWEDGTLMMLAPEGGGVIHGFTQATICIKPETIESMADERDVRLREAGFGTPSVLFSVFDALTLGASGLEPTGEREVEGAACFGYTVKPEFFPLWERAAADPGEEVRIAYVRVYLEQATGMLRAVEAEFAHVADGNAGPVTQARLTVPSWEVGVDIADEQVVFCWCPQDRGRGVWWSPDSDPTDIANRFAGFVEVGMKEDPRARKSFAALVATMRDPNLNMYVREHRRMTALGGVVNDTISDGWFRRLDSYHGESGGDAALTVTPTEVRLLAGRTMLHVPPETALAIGRRETLDHAWYAFAQPYWQTVAALLRVRDHVTITGETEVGGEECWVMEVEESGLEAFGKEWRTGWTTTEAELVLGQDSGMFRRIHVVSTVALGMGGNATVEEEIELEHVERGVEITDAMLTVDPPEGTWVVTRTPEMTDEQMQNKWNATARAEMGEPPTLLDGDRTLVAWVSPANLGQHKGAVISLSNMPAGYDAIVLGEVRPGCWMEGSDFHCRTSRHRDDQPVETAAPGEFVQIAIVHSGRDVTIYRNGEAIAQHTFLGIPPPFGTKGMVLLGRTYEDAAPEESFLGATEDARIYDRALTPEELASLEPDQQGTVEPWAWWSFEGDTAADARGRFADAEFQRGARIEAGKLILDQPGATAIAPLRDEGAEGE